jgi:hypothetical protein
MTIGSFYGGERQGRSEEADLRVFRSVVKSAAPTTL